MTVRYARQSTIQTNKPAFMISKKDYLLLRPWQEKRYENHRRKVNLIKKRINSKKITLCIQVLSASPAIDTKPPLHRQHVIVKLKKRQKESERCQEIEKNNLTLLKRLNHVSETNRIDNYWDKPLPT